MKTIKAMRIEHWLKNTIIFIPYFLAGNNDLPTLYNLIILFLGFSLVVSSTYILNDIFDAESDKYHPKKKYRPVASDSSSIQYWIKISVTLFITGIYIVNSINSKALILCLIYVLISIGYSVKLKYLKYFDLITITLLFLLRILLGGIPSSIFISSYLLFFIFFKSLELVTSKKLSILINQNIHNSKVKSFLVKSYTQKYLELIILVCIVGSCLTYLIWIFFAKFALISNLAVANLLISSIFLFIFDFKFFNETRKGNTEDIFNLIKNNFSILFSLSFFGIFCFLGIV